ncbi:MAG: SWIM zinc finger family protein [bacterium]|nr:SWIM zinc finger family protein [bacterium]
MKPVEIKKLQARSRKLQVRLVAPNTLVVTSRSNPYAHHIVTIESEPGGVLRGRCTCPWAQNGGLGCSHMMAALNFLASRQKRVISFWEREEDAQRQRHRVLRLVGARREDDIFITSRPAA